MHLKRVYIKTFGCQMNEHDSQKIELMLRGLGYVSTDLPEQADLILFNTCTIREKARHKAISEIGRAPTFKRQKPSALVGVCGCVAQQDGVSLLDRYPGVDFVFGPDQLWRLPELIEHARAGNRAWALDLIDDPKEYRFPDATLRVTNHESRITEFVLVSKGCNCACSYCIVPSVRGREISRPEDEIVAEVGRLASLGAKEVTLLGQNVSSYGRGGLAALIGRIARETDIMRIRFTSPHPLWIGEDLVREYAENEKLCPHIHLPVQAGSNAVLKNMRRGYSRERYLDIVRSLRAARTGLAITTDLIVGFPGETEADFEDTLRLMREAEFDQAFAFKYSPRPGTEAAEKMEDDVPLADKERRLSVLLDLQRRTSRARNEALVGKRAEALATGMDRMNNGLVTGRLPDNRIVHFAGHPNLVGSIVPVAITAAHDNSLSAEMVQ